MTKKHLNIRIPEELWEKLEESGQKHTEIVTEALTQYLCGTCGTNTIERNTERGTERNTISTTEEVEHLRALLHSRDELISTLQTENGFLISEFQKLSRINERLLLSPAQEEIVKKSWWQFWKK